MIVVDARRRASRPLAALVVVAALAALGVPSVEAAPPRCPTGMVLVGGGSSGGKGARPAGAGGPVCVDQHEASLARVDGRGRRQGGHPHVEPVGGRRVRAETKRGVFPQAYITQREAATACEEAGKRLCNDDEWTRACQGKVPTLYPYGDEEVPGRCNTQGVSPLLAIFGADDPGRYGFEAMNDPRLNRVAGGLARTGAFKRCRNGWGLHDMVGNLHEWTADPGGTFRGGYFLDTHQNGDGCRYVTKAHVPTYRDYSIGFRCCADPGAGRRRGRGAAERPGTSDQR